MLGPSPLSRSLRAVAKGLLVVGQSGKARPLRDADDAVRYRFVTNLAVGEAQRLGWTIPQIVLCGQKTALNRLDKSTGWKY